MTNFELADRLNGLKSEKVGKAIQFYREALGVTFSDLASRLGVSRQTISRYEYGRVRLNNKLQFLEKLANALGISLEDLLSKAE